MFSLKFLNLQSEQMAIKEFSTHKIAFVLCYLCSIIDTHCAIALLEKNSQKKKGIQKYKNKAKAKAKQNRIEKKNNK